MTRMTEAQRQSTHAENMRREDFDASPLLKAEWRQVIDAADEHGHGGLNDYDGLIPPALRVQMTDKQKINALIQALQARLAFGISN